MKTIAFRIWDKERKKFWFSGSTPMMLHSFFENTAVLNTRDGMSYQQYSGLSDKNEAWIYEGDIIKTEKGRKMIRVVEWTDYCWDMTKCSNSKVIGNIYENPELLNNN